MAFYAGKIIQHPAMANPTLVVLTDRNDLDDQLFGTFAACKDLLRQTPEQAESRERFAGPPATVRLAESIFTTIQKFLPERKASRYPLLSDRRNIVVIADEAHRSQYDFIDGFARHMRDALPNASFHRLHGHAFGSRATEARPRSLATTSTFTTSSGRSKTERLSESTTRAGLPSLN